MTLIRTNILANATGSKKRNDLKFTKHVGWISELGFIYIIYLEHREEKMFTLKNMIHQKKNTKKSYRYTNKKKNIECTWYRKN